MSQRVGGAATPGELRPFELDELEALVKSAEESASPEASLHEKIDTALNRLPSPLGSLVRLLFGVGGVNPSSPEEFSAQLGISRAALEEEKARALRALMGYNRRSRGRKTSRRAN